MSKDELATVLEQESRMLGDAEDDAREIGVLRVARGTDGRASHAGSPVPKTAGCSR